MPTNITREQIDAARVTLSRSEYDSICALNQSRARFYARSPAHGLNADENRKEPTDAMILGILSHAMLFDPDEVNVQFVLAPTDAPKRPDKRQLNAKKPSPETIAAIEFWETFEREAAGRSVISREMLDTAGTVAARASEAFKAYGVTILATEVALRAEYAGIALKGSLDVIDSDGFIWDLKTTSASATPEDYGKDLLYEADLALQNAFYRLLFRENFGTTPAGFRHLVVETKPPHGFRAFEQDDEIVARGVQTMLRAFDNYSAAVKSPGVPPGYPIDIHKVSPWKPNAGNNAAPIPFA